MVEATEPERGDLGSSPSCSKGIDSVNGPQEAGEMAQQSRALATLSEDPGLALAPTGWLTTM